MDVTDLMISHMRAKVFRFERDYLASLAAVDDIQREADRGTFSCLNEIRLPDRKLKITARRAYNGDGFLVHFWGMKGDEIENALSSPGGWTVNRMVFPSMSKGGLTVFFHERDDV